MPGGEPSPVPSPFRFTGFPCPGGLAPAALAGHGGGRPPGNHRADRRVRPHPYPVDSGRVLRLAGLAQSPCPGLLPIGLLHCVGSFGSG